MHSRSAKALPSKKNAAFWTGSSSSGHLGTELVEAWADDHGLAGVVLTGLPTKSPITERNNDHPSVRDVISHLGGLEGDSARRAEEYVRRAPIQIATAFRTHIVAEFGWANGHFKDMKAKVSFWKSQCGIAHQGQFPQWAAS